MASADYVNMALPWLIQNFVRPFFPLNRPQRLQLSPWKNIYQSETRSPTGTDKALYPAYYRLYWNILTWKKLLRLIENSYAYVDVVKRRACHSEDPVISEGYHLLHVHYFGLSAHTSQVIGVHYLLPVYLQPLLFFSDGRRTTSLFP